MIELTQEQRQAIAQEENPSVIEPASKPANAVRQDVLDQLRLIVDSDTPPASLLDVIAAKVGIALTEAEKAFSLRVIWMRRMGLDEDEITDSLRTDPPANVVTEMTELLALEKLKTITPSRAVLEKIAIKYY